MSKFEHFDADTAFVPPRNPYLSDVIASIRSDDTLSATRRRDMVSGLQRISKALNRSPNTLPADAKWLQPRLAKIHPAAIGLRNKSWSNALSDARAALVHCKLVETRKNTFDDLSPDWQALWKMILVSTDPGLKVALSRFVYFLSRHSVAPAEVSDIHAQKFFEAVKLNEIRKSPEVAYRSAITSWNRAAEKFPNWPQHRLTLPARTNKITLTLTDFPQSFQDDLDRYISSLEAPDLFDPLARTSPLRTATIASYRKNLLRFASRLVHAGTPIEEFTGLAYLVQPKIAEKGFRLILEDSNQKVTSNLELVAGLLSSTARRYVRVSGDDLSALKRLTDCLQRPAQSGMTEKNRTRLRSLRDSRVLHRLRALPDRLTASRRSGKLSNKALLAQEIAVAIAILQYCPVRAGNLAAIDIERHLVRPGNGRVFLVFKDGEVKTGRGIEFELPSSVVRLIDNHLATRSPSLCAADSRWLFPKRNGQGPIPPRHLGERIKKCIRREVGVDINPHLFRHLAATLWLEQNPGAYEAARHFLGHATLSQTLALYADFEATPATRLFAEMVSREAEA